MLPKSDVAPVIICTDLARAPHAGTSADCPAHSAPAPAGEPRAAVRALQVHPPGAAARVF